ncbi:unnamed protein product, partial [Rotaria sp. Silwood1]
IELKNIIQMEIKTNSIINNENNDEYFIPLEPNHALALTMNFPQFPEAISSKTSFIQTGLFIIFTSI